MQANGVKNKFFGGKILFQAYLFRGLNILDWGEQK